MESDAEDVTVKVEPNALLKTADITDDPNMVYSCEACDMTFTSVEEHLAQFHENEEVLLETEEPEQLDQENDAEEETIENECFEEDPDDDNWSDTADNISEELTSDGFENAISEEESELQESKPVTTKYVVESGEVREISEEEACNLKKTVKILEIHSCSNCKLQFPNITHFHKHKCSNAHKFIKKGKSKEPEILQAVENTKKEKKSKYDVAIPGERCRFQCTFCMVDYACIEEINEHMKSHLVYDNTGAVKETIITMSLHVCEFCNTKFPTYKQLQLHLPTHGPVTSKEIGPSSADEQTNEENTRETFNCVICNKLYDKRTEEVHMKSHHDGLNKVCLVCNKTFEPKESLEMHIKAHSKAKKLLCSYCKKSFNRYELLKKHVENQCQKRDFKCSFCGRRFAKSGEKIIHERIHTGEKPHVCEHCGKSFRISYCLTLHMRTHTGNRPYACTYEGCNKRFKSLSIFNNHLMTHSDVRNHKCPYCPKAFKTIVQLAAHKNSHTKPFSCTECNRPFASLYAVRAHMQTHKRTNNLKFYCWICGANYARSFALKDHMNEVHGEQPNTETQEQQAGMELEAATEEIQAQHEDDVEIITDQSQEIELIPSMGQPDVEEQGEYQITEDGSDMCEVQVINAEDSELYVGQTQECEEMPVEAQVEA